MSGDGKKAAKRFRIRLHDLRTDTLVPVHPEDMPSLLANDPRAAGRLLAGELAKRFRIRVEDLESHTVMPPVHPDDLPVLLEKNPERAIEILRTLTSK